MADEATPTPNSTDQTPPADTAVDAPADKAVDAPSDATALGNGPEDKPADALGDKPVDAPGDKPADEPAKGPPEAYDLTAPEGMTLDKEAMDAAVPIFREIGLSNEDAQKLMPVASQFAQKIADGLNQQILTQVAVDRKAWLDEAKADAEIGGANWDKSVSTAAVALDKLGYPKGSKFRTLLDDSGLGNNPEMIRAFKRIGEVIGEDASFARGDTNSAKKTDAELFYPAKSA